MPQEATSAQVARRPTLEWGKTMTETVRFICLAPCRNDSWALGTHLKVASQWADRIIVGDQMSTDATREIVGQSVNAMLVDNTADDEDEGERIARLTDVSDEDLPVLYSGAMAFLFPSTFEGFGLPVLEAMQCGTPVICSNATSLPEVGGAAPNYCDPMDVPAYAEAIISLANDLRQRKLMSKAALEQARQFAWRKTATSVHKAIQRLIGQPATVMSYSSQ